MIIIHIQLFDLTELVRAHFAYNIKAFQGKLILGDVQDFNVSHL